MKKFKNDGYYTNWRNQMIQLSPKVIDKILDDYFKSIDVWLPLCLIAFAIFLLGVLIF